MKRSKQLECSFLFSPLVRLAFRIVFQTMRKKCSHWKANGILSLSQFFFVSTEKKRHCKIPYSSLAFSKTVFTKRNQKVDEENKSQQK